MQFLSCLTNLHNTSCVQMARCYGFSAFRIGTADAFLLTDKV